MEQEGRSGFWSTLPGILAGSAALITAATGGYIAFNKTADSAAAASHPPTTASAEPRQAVASTTSAAGDDEEEVAKSSGTRRSLAATKARPAFNCALATTNVENMLCEDVDLAERDRRVAAQYFALKRTLPPGLRSQLLESQRQFLDRRSGCQTRECLADLYEARLQRLTDFASNQ
jgi:hypothetical protein